MCLPRAQRSLRGPCTTRGSVRVLAGRCGREAKQANDDCGTLPTLLVPRKDGQPKIAIEGWTAYRLARSKRQQSIIVRGRS